MNRLPMMVSGWFQIGWSRDISNGQVSPIRYFGSDLVVWRTETGLLCVADAHCPHLGAHLGHGGTVNGEFLRCPFHAMEWTRNGTSVAKACDRGLRTWPTREASGIMYVWHDEVGREPWFEPADVFGVFDDDLAEQDFQLFRPQGATVHRSLTIHPQYAMEDRVDRLHFVGTHNASVPHFVGAEFEEHRFRSDILTSFDTDGITGARTARSGVQSINVGLGVSYFRTWGANEQRDVLAVTPIDDEVSDVFHTIWIRRSHDGGEQSEDGQSLVATTKKDELLNDLRIWSNLRFTPVGERAAPHEADLVQFRSWARRFYPPSWAIEQDRLGER